MAVSTLCLQPSQWKPQSGFWDHCTREKGEAAIGITAPKCILTYASIQNIICRIWQRTPPHLTDTDIYLEPGGVLLISNERSVTTFYHVMWYLALGSFSVALEESAWHLHWGQWTMYVLSSNMVISRDRHCYYSDFKNEDTETWRY